MELVHVIDSTENSCQIIAIVIILSSIKPALGLSFLFFLLSTRTLQALIKLKPFCEQFTFCYLSLFRKVYEYSREHVFACSSTTVWIVLFHSLPPISAYPL
jgi:hypothetical protein